MELLRNKRKHSETSKQYIYRVLYDNIMCLQLEPGQAISEKDLATYLKVSRTPVREAINILESNQLIDVEPQKGTFISKLDSILIEESFFMRKTLDIAVLKEACENFTAEGIVELEKNLYFQEYHVKFLENSMDFFNLDDEFHFIIYKNVNKENLWNAIKTLSSHFDRLRVLDNLDKQHIVNSISQHKEILSLIKSQDTSNIDNVVYNHLSNYKVHFDNLIDNYRDYFTNL